MKSKNNILKKQIENCNTQKLKKQSKQNLEDRNNRRKEIKKQSLFQKINKRINDLGYGKIERE